MLNSPTRQPLTVGIAAREATNGHPAAWAAVTATGHTHTRTLPGDNEHTAATILLAAFEHLLTDPDFADTPLTVCSGSLGFVHHVQRYAAAWPHVTIQSTLDAPKDVQALVAQAGTAAETADQPAPAPLPKRIIAATDGSAGKSARVTGYGFITDHGHYGHGTSKATTALDAELAGISRVLTETPTTVPLTVLVDSRQAITIAETLKTTPPTTRRRGASREIQHKLHTRLADRDVTFRWVRGHSGNPLNEAADRLAVLARRSAQMKTPKEVTQQIAAQIAADARSAMKAASETQAGGDGTLVA